MRLKISCSCEAGEFISNYASMKESYDRPSWAACSFRFSGGLVDLTDFDFALEVIEFFDRQAAEKFDASLDLEGGLQKVFVLFFLAARECHRILNAPMGGNRRAREDGAPLARVVREGDDEVEMPVGKLVPGVSDRAGRIDLEVFAENLQHERMNVALGMPPRH